jgi:hypothetical protein
LGLLGRVTGPARGSPQPREHRADISERKAQGERRDAEELKRRLDETHERLKRETPPEPETPPY